MLYSRIFDVLHHVFYMSIFIKVKPACGRWDVRSVLHPALPNPTS